MLAEYVARMRSVSNTGQILCRKLKGTRPSDGHGHARDDNIKVYLK
jgi:hypothetical protein